MIHRGRQREFVQDPPSCHIVTLHEDPGHRTWALKKESRPTLDSGRLDHGLPLLVFPPSCQCLFVCFEICCFRFVCVCVCVSADGYPSACQPVSKLDVHTYISRCLRFCHDRWMIVHTPSTASALGHTCRSCCNRHTVLSFSLIHTLTLLSSVCYILTCRVKIRVLLGKPKSSLPRATSPFSVHRYHDIQLYP